MFHQSYDAGAGCYVPGRAESRNAQRRHVFATLRLTSNLEKEVLMPKVWLITGSSRGLGRALAEAVLAAGDKLIATARNPEQLADLLDKLLGYI